MVVALPDQHKVRFYRSKNLIKWELASEFGPAGAVSGVWECPDLMELKVRDWKGKPEGVSRWVLNVNLNPGGPAGGSGDQYFVGSFDGFRFIEDHPGSGPHWVDRGRDFYAATSFSNIPRRSGPSDDRVDEQLALRGQASLTSRTRRDDRGAACVSSRVCAENSHFVAGAALAGAINLCCRFQCRSRIRHGSAMPSFKASTDANAHLAAAKLQGSAYLLRLTLAAGDTAEAGIRLRRSSLNPNEDAAEETVIGIDRTTARIFVDRSHSGRVDWSPGFASRVWAPLRHPQAVANTMEIVVDHNSIEVFAEDGETVLTDLIYPAATSTGLCVLCVAHPARLGPGNDWEC